MDPVGKVFWLFIAICLLSFVIVIASFPTPVEPQAVRVEVYKDEWRKITVSEGLINWAKVEEFNVTYTQRVFVYNPTNYSLNIRVYWEFYPSELKDFSTFGSGLFNRTLEALETREITFSLNVQETALITNFEVMTKIEGELNDR